MLFTRRQRMEIFTEAVIAEGEYIDFEVPFSIQGIKGILSISYDILERIYYIYFDWKDNSERQVCLETKVPERVGEVITRMKRGIFLGDEPVFCEYKRKWMTNIRNLLLEAENQPPEICMVCAQDTFGYGNNAICYVCFVKSIQNSTQN